VSAVHILLYSRSNRSSSCLICTHISRGNDPLRPCCDHIIHWCCIFSLRSQFSALEAFLLIPYIFHARYRFFSCSEQLLFRTTIIEMCHEIFDPRFFKICPGPLIKGLKPFCICIWSCEEIFYMHAGGLTPHERCMGGLLTLHAQWNFRTISKSKNHNL
jgi:hypothetical protein